MSSCNHLNVQRSQFFDGTLCMRTVFTNNVGEVTHDVIFVKLKVDLVIENSPVKGSEASECIV